MTEQVVTHKLDKLKIDPTDVDSILDFWTHFHLEAPAYLVEAVKAFRVDSTLETQDRFRYALCKALSEGKEDIFSDDLFVTIKASSDKVLFHYEFQDQLETELLK